MTSTEIANMALGHLGTSRIADFEENSPAAENVRRFWTVCRRTALREWDWNFATARLALSAVANPPAGVAKAYTLPGDYLRLIELNGVAAGTGLATFEVERGLLITNEDPVVIKYIRDEETASLWDDSFAVFLSYRLAAAIAPSLSAQPSLAEAMQASAANALNIAKGLDAVEAMPRVLRGPKTSGYYLSRFE
jgi:hypothetical protein